MAQSRFSFIDRVFYEVPVGLTVQTTSLTAASGDYVGFLIHDKQNGQRILPTRNGAQIVVMANNSNELVGAYPARLGTADGHWLNVHADCDVCDLSREPVRFMSVAQPHSPVVFDRLHMHSGEMPFTATTDGIVFAGRIYDRIEVGYRYPANPDNAGDAVSFREDPYSFGVIQFLDRIKVAALLAEDGLGVFHPDNDYYWSLTGLMDLALPIEEIFLGRVAR